MWRKNEVMVGIAIVVAFLLGIFGIRFLQGLPVFDRGYSLVAIFTDARGLTAGSSVLVSGVRVGRVDGIRLADEGREVVIRMTIEPGVRIPRGGTAGTLGFAALLDVQLDITPGPPGNPPLQDGDTLRADPDPDVLELVQDIGPELIQRIDTLMVAASGTFTTAEGFLTAIQEDLIRTITSLEAAAAGTAGLTDDVQAFLESQGDTLALALANLNRVLQQTDATLQQLNTTTGNLDEVLAKLNEGQGTLGILLNEPDLHQQLETTLENLSQIIADFQENPARYLREMTLFRLF